MKLDPRTEDQLRLLCDARNRAICDILNETGEVYHVEELADKLVARDMTVVSSATYDDEFDETCFELHHERLPKLAEENLVKYDPETNHVTANSTPESNVNWQAETTLEGLISCLESYRDDEGGLGVVKGRDSVFEYARKLADEATEELFTLYVNTDLLKDECVKHGENALDRGVTLYIGSPNETVRELCRENLPEATVWEPQYDWLNTPTYPRVGRLILMDRQKVMLSILEESPSEGTYPEEDALVGNGRDNPLVVLVRELLGPRLDHLDYQSEHFQNKLHT